MADYGYPHTAVPHVSSDGGGSSDDVALPETPADSGLYEPIAVHQDPSNAGLFTTGS